MGNKLLQYEVYGRETLSVTLRGVKGLELRENGKHWNICAPTKKGTSL